MNSSSNRYIFSHPAIIKRPFFSPHTLNLGLDKDLYSMVLL